MESNEREALGHEAHGADVKNGSPQTSTESSHPEPVFLRSHPVTFTPLPVTNPTLPELCSNNELTEAELDDYINNSYNGGPNRALDEPDRCRRPAAI